MTKFLKGGKLLFSLICRLGSFDDAKFTKVFTKLYARLVTMDQHKYLPPKFSSTLKDLAGQLSIEGLSEEELKA